MNCFCNDIDRCTATMELFQMLLSGCDRPGVANWRVYTSQARQWRPSSFRF